MKRHAKGGPLLLVVVLALLIVGIVSPTAANAQSEPIVYWVPAYVGLLLGGTDVPPGPDLTPVLTLPEDEGGPGYARAPLVGDTMDISYGWVTYTRGLARTTPSAHVMKLWIDGPGDYDFVVGAKAARAFWGAPEVVEAPDFPPFNRNIGAKAYLIQWDYFLDLTVAGEYRVHFFQDYRHVITDLIAVPNPDYDENDPDSPVWLDKFAGHTMSRPGDGLGHSYFYFIVD